uniref:BPTI/Kunitz inhibitor domain-containing protein n=1 Tax=Amblyomma maculatum TaxID=34609 RepID=G3MP05_AMBMU
MHLSIAIITSSSLVASLLAEQQGKHTKEPNSESKCREAPPRLADDDLDDTNLMYIYNKTSGKCENDFVKFTSKTNAYSSFHQCVTECKTGQGAPYCAKPPEYVCDRPEGDEDSYYYDLRSGECIQYTACINPYGKEQTNDFFTKRGCENECKGFTSKDVCGTKETKED